MTKDPIDVPGENTGPIRDIVVDSNRVGAWPGDNALMYVDNEESKTICAIDTATLPVPHRYNPGRIAVTVENGKLRQGFPHDCEADRTGVRPGP